MPQTTTMQRHWAGTKPPDEQDEQTKDSSLRLEECLAILNGTHIRDSATWRVDENTLYGTCDGKSDAIIAMSSCAHWNLFPHNTDFIKGSEQKTSQSVLEIPESQLNKGAFATLHQRMNEQRRARAQNSTAFKPST